MLLYGASTAATVCSISEMDVAMVAASFPIANRLYLFAVMADSLLALDKFVIRPVPAAHRQTLHANILLKK